MKSYLQLHHGLLVFLPQNMNLLLRLSVNILQQFPQFGHFSLTFPVDIKLALSPTLGFGQPLTQVDDLNLHVMLFTLNAPAEALFGLEVLLKDPDTLLKLSDGHVGGVGGGVDVGVDLTGDVAGGVGLVGHGGGLLPGLDRGGLFGGHGRFAGGDSHGAACHFCNINR